MIYRSVGVRAQSSFVRRLVIVTCAGLLCGTAMAQTFPAKPIHSVIAFTAGGPTDVLGRAMATAMSKELGVQVVVENRVGANGNIGTAYVANQSADGYTILVSGVNLPLNPMMSTSTGYRAQDFVPVAVFAKSPMLLVVSSALGIKTVGELVAAAKAKPGAISYASGGGVGTNPHLAAEYLKIAAGINLQHIPYKGTADSIPDVVSGRVPVTFFSPVVAGPLAKDGRIIVLGITSPQRDPDWPNTPTLLEQGVSNYTYESWYAIMAHSSTPPAVLQRLNAAIAAGLDSPELQRTMATLGVGRVRTSLSAAAQYYNNEVTKLSDAVNRHGLQLTAEAK